MNKAENKLTEEEKDRRIELEIQTAKKIANKLFLVVSNKDFVKEVPDPTTRHQVVIAQLKKMDKESGTTMYEQFSNAYPMILKYMTQYLSYNDKAFEKFMREQVKHPGEGMKGFIEHQANYVKFLYVETCKAGGKRPNIKEANKRKQMEYEIMNKVVKDLEMKKKEAENEFDDESKHHLEEKRRELLDFVNVELSEHPNLIPDTMPEESAENDQQNDENTNHLEVVNSDDPLDLVFFESLSRKDQKARLETLYFLEETLTKELGTKDREIKTLEQKIVEIKNMKNELWLRGTTLEKKTNKSSKKK
jgi:hypothetical protein